MAKADKETIEQAPTEFTVMIEEFLLGSYQPEMKRAFRDLMKKEELTGRKTREEWQNLYTLFQTKPVSTPWEVWQESKKEEVSP
jgi:hypothetical protein